MSYNTVEISNADGSPVELYDIALGAESWHFTSGEEGVTIDAVDYDPLPVSRDGIPVGTEERKQEVGVTLPASHEFVQKYRVVVPGVKATITIRRFHRTDDDTETISLFKGVVAAVKFTNNGASAQVGIAPFTDNLGLPIPRYVYSGLCNHVLGDRWCQKDLDTESSVDGFAFKHIGTCTAVDNLHLQVSGLVTADYPDNFFQAGRIVTAAGDTRLIVRQTGNHIYVYVPLFEGTDLVDESVTLFAGCDHSLATCQTKFNNVINYGGFPFVPRNNPFATGLL